MVPFGIIWYQRIPNDTEAEADTPKGVDASVEAYKIEPPGAALRAAPGGPSQPSPTGKGDSRSGGEAFPLTVPYGEGGSPQARRMRGAAEVTGWKYARSKAPPFRGALTAPSTNHSRPLRPSSVSLTRASSPGGEAPAPRSPLDKIEQTCYIMVEK